MKNNIKKLATLFIVTALGFTNLSCNNDEEETFVSDKPVLSVVNKNITAVEGQPLLLQLKLSKAISASAEYKLVIKPNGTAQDQIDYYLPNGCLSNNPDCSTIEENGGIVGYNFRIPANTTNYTLRLETIADMITENTENFSVYFVSRRYLRGIVAEDTNINLKIND